MNGAPAAVGFYLLALSSPPRLPLPRPTDCIRSRRPRSSKSSHGGTSDPLSCRRWAVPRARGGGADVKSESIDVSDSIKFRDGLSKVVSPLLEKEEEEEVERFPKRWMIVILCFSAFLLCNMDRVIGFINSKFSKIFELFVQFFIHKFWQVNMSIAILPMSAEFGWNPATVGLIQSSFFWGYLLTQVSVQPRRCLIWFVLHFYSSKLKRLFRIILLWQLIIFFLG